MRISSALTHELSFLEPEGGPAQRGTVVVVPGRGERAEVYTRFGTRLSVDAYRVHVVTDPTVDANGARDQIASAVAGAIDGATHTPIVLAGSDTGALFAAALVATGELKPDGLILAGLPLAQDPNAPLPRGMKSSTRARPVRRTAAGCRSRWCRPGRSTARYRRPGWSRRR